MRREPGDVGPIASTVNFEGFACRANQGAWWQPWRRQPAQLRVVDRGGVVRLQREDAVVRSCTVASLESDLRSLVGDLLDFGDAGRTIPDVHLLVGGRLVNLSGLADEAQLLGLALVEVRAQAPDHPVVVILTRRNV